MTKQSNCTTHLQNVLNDDDHNNNDYMNLGRAPESMNMPNFNVLQQHAQLLNSLLFSFQSLPGFCHPGFGQISGVSGFTSDGQLGFMGENMMSGILGQSGGWQNLGQSMNQVEGVMLNLAKGASLVCVNELAAINRFLGCANQVAASSYLLGCANHVAAVSQLLECANQGAALGQLLGCDDLVSDSSPTLACVNQVTALSQLLGCVNQVAAFNQMLACVNQVAALSQAIGCVNEIAALRQLFSYINHVAAQLAPAMPCNPALSENQGNLGKKQRMHISNTGPNQTKSFMKNSKTQALKWRSRKCKAHQMHNAKGKHNLSNMKGGKGIETIDLKNFANQTKSGKKRALVVPTTKKEIQKRRKQCEENCRTKENINEKLSQKQANADVVDEDAKVCHQREKDCPTKENINKKQSQKQANTDVVDEDAKVCHQREKDCPTKENINKKLSQKQADTDVVDEDAKVCHQREKNCQTKENINKKLLQKQANANVVDEDAKVCYQVSKQTSLSSAACSLTTTTMISPTHQQHTIIHVSWKRPPPLFYKLNFDGSVHNNSAAAGFLIRESTSEAIFISTSNLGDCSSHLAEATALRNGLMRAVLMEIKYLIVEGDDLVLIEALQGNCKVPREINSLIKEIKVLLGLFSQFVIQHVFREANQAADWVARQGHHFVRFHDFIPPYPLELSTILHSDKLGITFDRRVT